MQHGRTTRQRHSGWFKVRGACSRRGPWVLGGIMHKNARVAAAIAAACSFELPAGAALAQTESSDQPKVEAAELETVTVTGSLLPTTPDAVAVPIMTVDAKQLEQNGVVTNPLEILRKAIPSFA